MATTTEQGSRRRAWNRFDRVRRRRTPGTTDSRARVSPRRIAALLLAVGALLVLAAVAATLRVSYRPNRGC